MVKKVPMSRIRDQYKKLKIDRKWILLGLLLLFASLLIDIWPVIFLIFFCVGNALLLSIDRYVNAPLDLELSTFSAVLFTVRYDVKWGIAAAELTKVAAIAYNRIVRVDHFFMIIGYVLAALMANLLTGVPIVLLGILVAIIVNAYVVFVSKFITMLSNYEIVMYGSSNFLFNTVLFIGFSELFRAIMI